mmetsp:Transcript_8732/g.26404  ORF Transcript_8732/g.26404 Transcript_8732/m.26404 type:complete len:144 (-) Transcript_8732:2101-2532(-)
MHLGYHHFADAPALLWLSTLAINVHDTRSYNWHDHSCSWLHDAVQWNGLADINIDSNIDPIGLPQRWAQVCAELQTTTWPLARLGRRCNSPAACLLRPSSAARSARTPSTCLTWTLRQAARRRDRSRPRQRRRRSLASTHTSA